MRPQNENTGSGKENGGEQVRYAIPDVRELDETLTYQREKFGFDSMNLDRTKMQVGERLVNLAPGESVTAEIKTGNRRVIEYFLSPLLQYQSESLHER